MLSSVARSCTRTATTIVGNSRGNGRPRRLLYPRSFYIVSRRQPSSQCGRNSVLVRNFSTSEKSQSTTGGYPKSILLIPLYFGYKYLKNSGNQLIEKEITPLRNGLDFKDNHQKYMDDFIKINKRVEKSSIKNEPIGPVDENLLGVSVYHICNEFRDEVKQSFGKNPPPVEKKFRKWWLPFQKKKLDDLNIYDVCDDVIKKKGEGIICPEDGKQGQSYVNCLKGEDHVGKANVMLSYAWGNKVKDICNVLGNYCVENNLDPKQTYVWICCLCNNQHRFDEDHSFNELERVFRDKVEGIGNVVSLFSPWDAPIYATRLWCVFELSTANFSKSSNIAIRMPSNEKEKMFHAIQNGSLEKLYKVLSEIDVRNATASKENDEVNILNLIEARGGPDIVNNEARKQSRTWVHETIKELIEEKAKSLQDSSNKTELAELYHKTGKIYHHEGVPDLAMCYYQKALALRRAVEPNLTSAILLSVGSLFMDQKLTKEALSAVGLAKMIAKQFCPNEKNLLAQIENEESKNFFEMCMNNAIFLGGFSYNQAMKESKETIERINKMGLVSEKSNEYSQALIDSARIAIKKGEFPNAQAFLNKALMLVLKQDCIKQNDPLEQVLKKLEAMPKHDREINRNLGEILFQFHLLCKEQDRIYEARRCCDLFLPIFRVTYGQYNPKLIDIYRDVAKVYQLSGDNETMRQCCDKALAILDNFERSSIDWKWKKECLQDIKEQGHLSYTTLFKMWFIYK